MFDSTALRGTPPTDLPPGVTFWNARSLVSGSPAGPSSATWQFTVPRASAAIDTYWGSVLDVNGDGHADAVIGAPTTASRGRMLVFLGSSTGLPLAPSTTTDAVTATGTYASAVGSAGDVNGDGFTDVIIGALGESGGRAYVFYGSAGGLGTAPTMLIGPSGGQFGASVAGAGDVNGDGYADVIVGAPQAVSPQGRAYVFLGGPGGISLTASVTLAGPDTGDFGISVSTAGDTNGDRFADVVVGAQTAPGGGRAYVYRGNAGGLFAGFATLISPSGTGVGSFGYTVATAGDMNGDGLTEVIVGGYRGDAHVYRGNAAGVGSPPFASYPAPVGSTQFAWVVAPAFDVNGDGLDDVIVGDNDADTQAGRAHVYLGSRTGPLTTVPATSINGPDGPGGRFGAALGGGDVDRDGFSDILVGSPRANLRAGRVRLFAGSAAGLSVTATSVLSGALAGDAFGSAIGH